jgi:hypothetical protein
MITIQPFKSNLQFSSVTTGTSSPNDSTSCFWAVPGDFDGDLFPNFVSACSLASFNNSCNCCT